MSEDKVLKVQILTDRYIPMLKRKGPITQPINITETLYNGLKSLGFDVKVFEEEGSTVIKTVETKPAVKQKEERKEEPKKVVEEKVEEVAPQEQPSTEEKTSDEQEETIEVVALTRKEYESMNVPKLIDYLNNLKEALPSEEQPFEGKTKKELLAIIDKYIID